MTNNLDRRIKQHNKGIKAGGARYTSTRGPVSLLKFFTRPTKSGALKLEHKIKKLPKQQKLSFVDNQG